MELTEQDISEMVCPWCMSSDKQTLLIPVYKRPGWLVGHCKECRYDWSRLKLEDGISYSN